MENKYIDKISEEVVDEIKSFKEKEDLINFLSQIFKAMSDPTRIKIIYALMKGPLCVSDISLLLDMSQSSISHQLSLLKNQNLIKVKRLGRRAYYSLDDEHVVSLFKYGLEHAKHKI
ncbi:metalloregulator ArsR/SmtB family transcription factor [Peptoniphilus sp. MSJ-1]|uniref:Metalloregulator ArsR/SmtB family transcription factor n=1 Tax=Peptoniphilus ovalis TaxID=2841503 RepID=A0ABS6FFF9_9FIRM|nr:metalloregulator ArsR/SmtB family transcription factor [Peptoniphilus ovalis]MBU5668719.1 metalloregulator ArsR/SmtB family transcription factor [Peptoniphilus ovalis]